MGQRWLRVVVVIITVLVLESVRWSNGCWDQERIALLQFKLFFSPFQGREDSDCCQWNYVKCNNTSRRVTKLSLAGVWYSNLINASLFLPFEELRNLDLGYNELVGCVEDEGFGKLSKLRHLEILDLSYNHFNDSILSSLSKISTLKSLSLSGNDLFTGSNHSNDLKWLSKVISLETLDLSDTNMTNNFLFHLGGLSSLKTLNLWTNNLQGTVHLQDLYNLTNLKKLNLGGNRIESIRCSYDFCALSNLETLDLSDNKLNQFVTSKENRCLRKLKSLSLDSVSINGNISLVSLLEPFPSVKTLSLRFNSFLNKTRVTQELKVLSKVETLIMDGTPLDINFLESIGILTSLKALSLNYCNLTGPLPAQGWCYLKSLEELSLRGNALRGAIAPCLDNLTSLRYLDISDNQFTGNVSSTPLTNLTMLQFLSLSKNQLQVPASFKLFSNHSNLQFLSSNENKFVAELAFQTWSPKFQLKVFVLSNCKIDEQGKLQFPNFLYYQYDLRYIDLSHCNFGEIRFPHWLLENNTRLVELHMIDSSVVGPLFLPSHSNSNLRIFNISNNYIGPDIPRNFCSLFPNLWELYMSQNAFKSKIPLCLGGMKRLGRLDLSHNKFFGGIPKELAMSNSLYFLGLSNNVLRGKIFSTMYDLSNSLTALYLDGNNFEGEFLDFSPIIPSNLQELDVSDNHLSGKLPRWLWNMTTLMLLNLSKNHLEGSIPVELCNLVNLEFLDFSQNHLSGTIPSCSNLQKIKYVHLSRNKLSGPLSDAFYRSSSLVTLDLSENNLIGRIPDWISTLPVLSILLLKANHFHGEFPNHLCRLYSLSILDLSQNKLSGPIPSCLSNLTLKSWNKKSDIYGDTLWFSGLEDEWADMGMGLKTDDIVNYIDYAATVVEPHSYPFRNAEEEIEVSTKNAAYTYKGKILDLLSVIDLSCNQLTGIIPPELGNLTEMRGLNLSHNNLTGPIPSMFSNLKQIESLDLSYNNLNGEIPPQLTELTFLEVFTVAYNNLSGPLPDVKAQFGTFNESSYEGNPLLCGLPLKNSCNEGDSPEILNASSSKEHGFIDMSDFYISFAVSYAIILLATVIVLYINPYWRQACLSFVEKRSTACYFFIVDTFHQLPA